MQTSMSKIEIHVREPAVRLFHELHVLNIYWVILSGGLLCKLFVEFWQDKGTELVGELSLYLSLLLTFDQTSPSYRTGNDKIYNCIT